ncbi:MAG: HupE/UreJ family protein [Bryobacteraceae bacterium]
MRWHSAAWMLMAAASAPAHMVSISTGEIAIEGDHARYVIRMPVYEVQHVKDAGPALLNAIHFSSGGAEARRTSGDCRNDAAENALVCTAEYEFTAPVEILSVSSSFHTLTVPNHVHVLRGTLDGKSDQAVLDLSFPKAQLRFRPPTLVEQATQQAAAGALRAAGGPAQWLFLAALVLAARSRREFVRLAVMLLAGEALSCLALPLIGWDPAPQFVEAACALTIAYLAVEILLLPEAGMRWLVVGVLGLFHGLYFSLFITGSEFEVGWVLLGVAATEVVLLVALGWALPRLARILPAMAARAAAWVLLGIGLGWFFLRLRN